MLENEPLFPCFCHQLWTSLQNEMNETWVVKPTNYITKKERGVTVHPIQSCRQTDNEIK